MGEVVPTLEEAWAAVASLPLPERRALVEKLLQEVTEAGEEAVVVVLHRFSPAVQARMDELLTKSNEGALTEEERAELTALVAEYERIMLANTEALLRASRPELFDTSGRLVRSRLVQAIARETGSKSS